jgi:putative Holliday junction resolvase
VETELVIGRIAGIDYGRKRIGLAIGHTSTGIASPAGTIAGARAREPHLTDAVAIARDAAAVVRWARESDVVGIVVGHPLNMDGTSGPQARLCGAFAAEVRGRGAAGAEPGPHAGPPPAPLVVELWDERLSSFQADAHLRAAGVKKTKRLQKLDALAAQVILQSYLDARGAA